MLADGTLGWSWQRWLHGHGTRRVGKERSLMQRTSIRVGQRLMKALNQHCCHQPQSNIFAVSGGVPEPC